MLVRALWLLHAPYFYMIGPCYAVIVFSGNVMKCYGCYDNITCYECDERCHAYTSIIELCYEFV